MLRRLTGTIIVAVMLLGLAGCAALKDGSLADILNSGQMPLSESTVAAGLKEALRVGTERSTLSVGAVDGYLANAMIRIAVPEDLRVVTDKLRQLGLGNYVDDLEVGMNRAAEAAAGEAKSVFWLAVTSMTIADAFAILNGGDHAATDYFIAHTRQTLETRYRPIAAEKMQEVGLSRLYDEVLDVYNAVPLIEKPEMAPLDAYVTSKALDGLFTVLALEETKIRTDPVARTTDLLREVFGRN
jgi:Protein of unknown function (DUF4197)